MPLRSHHLADETWPKVAARRDLVLVVPIGSCEQHGPHLPLDTDTRIACAIADALAASRRDLTVAPALAVTASGEHQGFAGTLSIGVVALSMVLVEVVRSAQWCTGVVFINGHGGNAQAVREATDLLRSEGRNVLAWWPQIVGGDAHAGRTETSLMLAIAPHAVRLDQAVAGRTEPLPTLIPQLLEDGVISVSPNGVLGDPRGASAKEGRELLAQLVNDALARIQFWLA